MFADIFYNNSLKNGLLPVVLPEEVVTNLWATLEATPDARVTVDLQNQTVTLPDGSSHGFQIDAFRKLCLLDGVDDLGYLLNKNDVISTFEAKPRY
jgi:3-isopropylmalate/(R)-2-methylmalate dehydratase small subunit